MTRAVADRPAGERRLASAARPTTPTNLSTYLSPKRDADGETTPSRPRSAHGWHPRAGALASRDPAPQRRSLVARPAAEFEMPTPGTGEHQVTVRQPCKRRGDHSGMEPPASLAEPTEQGAASIPSRSASNAAIFPTETLPGGNPAGSDLGIAASGCQNISKSRRTRLESTSGAEVKSREMKEDRAPQADQDRCDPGRRRARRPACHSPFTPRSR